MRKLFLCVLVLFSTGAVFATSEYYDAFMAHYKLAETSAYGEKSCGVCHVSDSDFAFNPYGNTLKAKLVELNKNAVDDDVLLAVEIADSDGDGTSNKDEIAASTFPGDPASGAKPGAPAVKPAAKPKPEGMIPKNAFHPAIVHFPIALFIAGLLLDALGMLTKHKELLLAGWYNLVLAALSAVGGIGSGLLAMTLKGYPMTGHVQQHLILAVVSSLIMWALVAMRVHRHEKMNIPLRAVYYVLAFAALFLISWAGHVGGDLVYG